MSINRRGRPGAHSTPAEMHPAPVQTNSARSDPVPAGVPDDAEYTLADLAPGARAIVVRVVAQHPATGRRLEDLGFTPGTLVHVVRRAPLRDPVIYRLKDYEVCLRRAQAACVRTAVADR